MSFDYTWYSLSYRDLSGVKWDVTIKSETQDTEYAVSGYAILEYPEAQSHLQPIRSSALRLELQSIDGIEFERLWTATERSFLVELKISTQTYFIGFIKPDGIFRSYTERNYNISIDCVGGLGYLENLAYVDNATGVPFAGITTAIRVIARCLLRTGLELEIWAYTDLVYDGLLDTDEVLEKVKVKQERYYRDDNETPMDCKEVLEDLLEVFGVCVCQHEGKWFVYDPLKIAANIDIGNSFKAYSPQGVYRRDETIFLQKRIGSEITGQSDAYFVNKNQQIETRAPISGIRVNYKYGLDESLLNNEFLDHNGVSYAGWTINDPTKHAFGPNNRGALISHDETAVVMSSDAVALAQDDLIRVEFSVSNAGLPSASRSFAYRVRIGTSHYLKNGTWSTTPYTNISELLANQTTIITRTADPLPVAGNVIVELMGFEFVTTTQGSLTVSRVSISPQEGGNTLPVDGEFHTSQIPGGSVVADNREVYNGDNSTAIYYGTLYESDGITPTQDWKIKGTTDLKPVLRHLSEKIITINKLPMRYFAGDVYNLIGFLQVIRVYGAFQGENLMVMGYSLNTKTRIATIQLQRIFGTAPSGMLYEFTLDYGKTVKPTIVG